MAQALSPGSLMAYPVDLYLGISDNGVVGKLPATAHAARKSHREYGGD